MLDAEADEIAGASRYERSGGWKAYRADHYERRITAKAGTLGKFHGRDFVVHACYGHVRDLPKKGISVDREAGYEPTYEVLPGKQRTIADLKKLIRQTLAATK